MPHQKDFIMECPDPQLENIRFIIADLLNNVDTYSHQEIEDLLFKEENFWIGSLITQHKGLNASHNWNRSKRTDREK